MPDELADLTPTSIEGDETKGQPFAQWPECPHLKQEESLFNPELLAFMSFVFLSTLNVLTGRLPATMLLHHLKKPQELSYTASDTIEAPIKYFASLNAKKN